MGYKSQRMRPLALGLVLALLFFPLCAQEPVIGGPVDCGKQFSSACATDKAHCGNIRSAFGMRAWTAYRETASEFGTALPPGLSRQDIGRLLLQNPDRPQVLLENGRSSPLRLPEHDDWLTNMTIGAKRWGPAGTYVIFANTGGFRSYLGLARLTPKGPVLLAKSGAITDVDLNDIDWKSGLIPPLDPADVGDGNDHSSASLIRGPGPHPGYVEYILPERLDLAPYHLRAGRPAIGLRVKWIVSQAQDSHIDYQALLLFEQHGTRLRRVAAIPTASFHLITHGSDDNGELICRLYENENVLSIGGKNHDAYPAITLTDRLGGQRQRYRWSSAKGRYVADLRARP